MTEGDGSPEVPIQNESVRSQWRFDKLMELNRRFVFRRPEVLGIENLAEIPSHFPLIIVASHFSDADLQVVASELRPRLKGVRPNRSIGLSLQSENLVDFRSAFFIKLAGRKHFFEIDARFDKEVNHLHFLFNPENFRKMAEALLGRTDIIIAAHEPLSNIPDSRWELPPNSGLGAAYLVQIADATVLPVAIDIQTENKVGMSADIGGAVRRLLRGERPDIRIVIGKPILLERIDKGELENFGQYYQSRFKKLTDGLRTDETSPEEQIKARAVLKIIRAQNDMIMRRIADLLPEAKRGRWKGESNPL